MVVVGFRGLLRRAGSDIHEPLPAATRFALLRLLVGLALVTAFLLLLGILASIIQ